MNAVRQKELEFHCIHMLNVLVTDIFIVNRGRVNDSIVSVIVTAFQKLEIDVLVFIDGKVGEKLVGEIVSLGKVLVEPQPEGSVDRAVTINQRIKHILKHLGKHNGQQLFDLHRLIVITSLEIVKSWPIKFPQLNGILRAMNQEIGLMRGDYERTVFLVHGTDPSNNRHEVARFIESMGLKVVILSEQVHRGMTSIMDRLEEQGARSEFAVILLTPDDKCEANNGIFRARQNVILELGYFIGILGRDKVFCLKNGDLELPSDIHGIFYIDMEKADWGSKLKNVFE